MASKFTVSNRADWLIAGPAALLIAGFVILSFILAFYFPFSRQRLVGPNPTEFVGPANLRKLPGVMTPTPKPVRGETAPS